MSIGFEFVRSISYDQFAALHKLIHESGGYNWTVRDPNTGEGDLEVSSWSGHHWVIDAVGKVKSVRRWTSDKAPDQLMAGVNWWLNSDPKHSEDVVLAAEDGQDALILSGFNNVDTVAWVNPDGTVRTMTTEWRTVHTEEES